MTVKCAQIFVRDIGLGNNEYLICGIVKTDAPISGESIHVVTAEAVVDHEVKDISGISAGHGLDDLVKEPIWRKFA